MDLFAIDIMDRVREICRQIEKQDIPARVDTLNAIRRELHAVSPFATEPVDCVQWVPADTVTANDYNPNSVAPPEMRLLATSILADGYTQPIVGNREDERVIVIDGFHRHRVGRENPKVRKRVHGYLPVAQIRTEQGGRQERMASTIRHNRARGQHSVDKMSEIVAELAKKGWDDAKIAHELGMDADEVLRLKQITGLAELFADRDFSEAWEIERDDGDTSAEAI
jgi:ParB-like chromosome segregation protein Spo0J